MHSIHEQLEEVFNSHPDGAEGKTFLANAGIYFHMIDDLIDRDLASTPENFATLLILSLNIYSCNFYNKYQHILYSVIRNIHHTFFDTVRMERSTVLWHKEHAEILKSVGQDLTLTVVEILGGYEKRRELSTIVRDYSYTQQNNIIELQLAKG